MKIPKPDLEMGSVTSMVVTPLNIGVLMILVAIYLTNFLVDKNIDNCRNVSTLTLSRCFRDIPISHITILFSGAILGVVLVIRYASSTSHKQNLFFIGLALLTLYPAYTVYRVNANLESCQQLTNFANYCTQDINDLHYGHYIISAFSISLGSITLLWLLQFYYRQRTKHKP